MSDSGTVQTPNQPIGPGFADGQPRTDNARFLAAVGYSFWIIVPAIVLRTDLRGSVLTSVHALLGLVFSGVSLLFLILYRCRNSHSHRATTCLHLVA